MLNNHILKPETMEAIARLGPTAEKVADRWVSGWKKQTLELEKNGQLLPRLKDQAEREAEIYAKARMGREYSHLAQHEIAQLFDLPPGP